MPIFVDSDNVIRQISFDKIPANTLRDLRKAQETENGFTRTLKYIWLLISGQKGL